MLVRSAVVIVALGAGLIAGPAEAAFVDTFTQVGTNVVLQGAGTLDTSDLQLSSVQDIADELYPSGPQLVLGGSTDFLLNPEQLYDNVISETPTFGQGNDTGPDVASGDAVGFQNHRLIVPDNYTSGAQLSSYAEFDGQTFRSLGLASGTYTYTFGSGADTDTFTVVVPPVPLPASAPMFGAALMALGAFGYGVKRKGKAAAW